MPKPKHPLVEQDREAMEMENAIRAGELDAKDCPFCAQRDLEISRFEALGSKAQWLVTCMSCGAFGPAGDAQTPQGALLVWNAQGRD